MGSDRIRASALCRTPQVEDRTFVQPLWNVAGKGTVRLWNVAGKRTVLMVEFWTRCPPLEEP